MRRVVINTFRFFGMKFRLSRLCIPRFENIVHLQAIHLSVQLQLEEFRMLYPAPTSLYYLYDISLIWPNLLYQTINYLLP